MVVDVIAVSEFMGSRLFADWNQASHSKRFFGFSRSLQSSLLCWCAMELWFDSFVLDTIPGTSAKLLKLIRKFKGNRLNMHPPTVRDDNVQPSKFSTEM